jgi:hypothetical protein
LKKKGRQRLEHATDPENRTCEEVRSVSQSTTLSAPRKPKSKKQRYARVLGYLEQGGEHVVRIEERGPRSSKDNTYYLSQIGSDYGTAFRWEKFACEGGDVYHVNLGDADNAPSCDCKGFCRFGYCKHLSCTRVLVERGKLSS